MSEKVKKTRGKKILKWFFLTVVGMIFLIGIAIGIILNFVFTPAKITPLVEKTAAQYLKADIHIGEIELTFFSTFPDLGLKITDASIVSNVLRDTSLQAAQTDSLMYIKECLVTVNPVAYLRKNEIKVKDFILDAPRIYAFIDKNGQANWNMTGEVADSLVADSIVPQEKVRSETYLDIKNVKIRNGWLVFDDRNTQLYSRVEGLNLDVDGDFLGRTAELQLDLSAQNLLLWQEGKLLVRRLALGVETRMNVNRDSLLYTLEKAVFTVNGIKFGAGGRLQADTVNRTVLVDIKYGIHIPSLKTLLDLVPADVLDKDKKVDVRGDVLCTGTLTGLYGKKNIPLFTSEFKIKDGYIAYEGMPSQIEQLDMDFFAQIDLQKEQPSYIQLDHFCMKGGKTDIDVVGRAENILEDPVIRAKLDADIDFDDLTRIFPLTDGVNCEGKIAASLKTNVLLSDVMAANYGRLKVGGWCKMQDVAVFIPKDSIVMNVKSAGIGFATNRKNEKVLQGVDFLNGIVGYSGLDIHVKNKVRLLMDTTYLTLKTTPLKDTLAIATVNSGLHIGRTLFIVRDTLLLGVKQMEAKAKLMPSKRNKDIPRIEAQFQFDSLRLRALNNRLNIARGDLQLSATRSRRNERIWFPSGYIDFEGLRAYTPYFPLRIRMPGTRVHFDRQQIFLDSAVMRIGRSDVRLTGSLSNLTRAFFKKEDLKAELTVQSKMINCNQIMRALDMGTVYMNKVQTGYKEAISTEEDDMDNLAVASDSIGYEGNSAVFVVPPGIDFTFKTDIDKMIFGNLLMDSIHGEMVMKNQCIEVSDLELRSSAANMDATLIYKATDTLRAYTGFALKMHDIRIDSLVRVIPALDTLFPMLKSFEGVVDFHISAESWLDSAFMIDLPTLRAAAYLDGHDLVLMDGETFAEISKMLMFKNKKRNMIDSISVDFLIKDGVIEIFPFLLEMDRYKVAVGGEHNIDMTFKYHVSLLKSPIPFRAGVDISGSLEKIRFRITKAKYKNLFIPSRRAKVDSAQLNLRQRIRTLLREGGNNELN
ncbi:AsmA family protein [uncultured Odoribacter sp.]|uniref:AsmA family protein n=1 Tax=uncultured Odoribacter sp. TaxID=876416 RepID=UPI00263004BE|nr:AsmA family protein [uncultured Odoribacter sp.]